MAQGQASLDLGNGLRIEVVAIGELREQDTNAHVMPPAKFERLVENIRRRGALESLPYCVQPGGEGPVEIVSGHHRVRAANAAGLTHIAVLVDTSTYSRSAIVAKQLAHNALVGHDDEEILKQLVATIDNPDDLLMTGLPKELLPGPEHDAMMLFTPRIDFDWRTVTFAFLPHQIDNLEKLLDSLDGQQDLVLCALREQFEPLLHAAAKLARIKKIRAGGTVLALLTEMALSEVQRAEQDERTESEQRPTDETD